MISKTCMDCRYWLHIDGHSDFLDNPLANWGLCRRYPPAVGFAEDSGYGFNSDSPGGFPITDGTDWCGEYQREAKSNE
jgi:hypothetical protein